ncbi:hypothetical protein [Saccharopolyspora kobensis]|nr:hypothetical protein [Saccharopolyspora kobensis]
MLGGTTRQARPGSRTRAVDVVPDAEFRADFTGLWPVTARFA